ncbi:MAG: NAD(P)/FAD-dependent oxidoreductase [Moraxellaceae bacterium]|nr:NAD(P)/FAD-dependent oxidoreductase [Moraxellaceae bacterium]
MNASLALAHDGLSETHPDRAAFMPPVRLPLADAPPASPRARSLEELEQAVARELSLGAFPAKSWVLPKTAPDGSSALDVLIVGGGQSGLGLAFALAQQRVTNVLVIDENPHGLEGPWGSYARMRTLRTKKDVGGIEFGIPSLSVQAWVEAQDGPAAWAGMNKLPTLLWHRYLQWYRKVLDLPVRNACRMTGFHYDTASGLMAVTVEEAGQMRTLWCRKLVLASGIEGNGVRNVPALVVDKLPKTHWAHSQELIDFQALRGKRVAILGGGASAFDNAATAAEAGAHVELYHRSAVALRHENPITWAEFTGYLAHFCDLDPATRWKFIGQLRKVSVGVPVDTYRRVKALPAVTVHPLCGWEQVELAGDAVRIHASDGSVAEVDYIICATGYLQDLAIRPEFAPHLPHIALWRDCYTPEPGDDMPNFSRAPFLGPHFELQEKTAGSAPWLRNVFNFSRAAQPSMGPMAIGLSGIKFGIPRVVQGVTRQLFADDSALYLEGLQRWQRETFAD